MQNLISLLTTDVHSEEAPRTYCIIINALTGATCSQVMKHLGQIRRGQLDQHDHIPTLDERNKADEATRGDEVVEFLFGTDMPAMKAAQICDGIRYHLYQQMHAWGEFADEKALIFTPPTSITQRINYNQPMSAQMYMEFRIDNATRANNTEITIAAKRLQTTEDIVRQALLAEGERNRRLLNEIKPNVLTEINSFEDVYDDNAFTSLSIELQCAIAEKIAAKFDREYMRALPRAIRSLEAASELVAIESQHKIVKQWLRDNDKELQSALLTRKAA